jgi:hypothetical protein
VRSSAWFCDFSLTDSARPVCRRVEIEPGDIAQFGDGRGIPQQLRASHPVRLQTVCRLDALTLHRAQPQASLTPNDACLSPNSGTIRPAS